MGPICRGATEVAKAVKAVCPKLPVERRNPKAWM